MKKTRAPDPATQECLHCSRRFTPNRVGHLFCSSDCRHRGARRYGGPDEVDHEAVARLFAEDRKVDRPVADDDWHPNPDTEWERLDAWQTVAIRRRWFHALVELGEVASPRKLARDLERAA